MKPFPARSLTEKDTTYTQAHRKECTLMWSVLMQSTLMRKMDNGEIKKPIISC